MDVETLEQRRDEIQVVDVRWPNEWEAGRIEGALHVPLDVFGDHLSKLDRSRPVVTVCRSGDRSARAAGTLAAEGFDAESLDGGMLAWEAAGLPVVRSGGAPGRVAEPEPPDGEQQRFHADVVELSLEVQEHFGDHEPSEEEIRGYLRDRMIREGHTPEEADEVLARITEAPSEG